MDGMTRYLYEITVLVEVPQESKDEQDEHIGDIKNYIWGIGYVEGMTTTFKVARE